MEGDGGTSISDVRARNGKRQSVFRSYTFPLMDHANLTVLTHALVRRPTFEGKRAPMWTFLTKARSIELALDSRWFCRSARSTPRRC
jgi:choline dehydrogenase-like flavoprotein